MLPLASASQLPSPPVAWKSWTVISLKCEPTAAFQVTEIEDEPVAVTVPIHHSIVDGVVSGSTHGVPTRLQVVTPPPLREATEVPPWLSTQAIMMSPILVGLTVSDSAAPLVFE